MDRRLGLAAAGIVCALAVGVGAAGEEASSLRLVPFPKEVRLEAGVHALDRPLVIETGRDAALLSRMVRAEIRRKGLPVPQTRANEALEHVLRIGPEPKKGTALPEFRGDATQEDYVLVVRPHVVVVRGWGASGLSLGVQTLCQLLRANQRDKGLPCLSIRDWPSLRWRCFQDDLTRGPSTKLDVLKRQLELGAFLKMDLFTYYMEYQYAFKKHPIIGPKDGSLTPEELKALVAHGKPLHVDILGNQQSFGHFAHILKHKEYAHLRETGGILCPTKEESYELLDDLYSEVLPLLPFPLFNVCCDETHGLGRGPSKPLAAKIGVGGVYAGHMRRIHDLLKDKYRKRMLMWGDIILRHPDHLKEIPKDTVMLTWGYGARPSFEHQIIPFAKSGYEFFVCPGVSNWSRILPDFGVATTNIRNFVRDGAKHGAIGMLNTAWDDDGENFNAPSWHGHAWGAECAWNASKTTPQDFNRRIGAVLFGESGDHFGKAIELLAKTHRVPGMHGMNNRRFWQLDLGILRGSASAARASAKRLLDVAQPAIEHLTACQKEATVNADLLDYFLFGARRMELIGQRVLDHIAAAEAYAAAYERPVNEAAPLLAKAEAIVQKTRDAHAALGKRFAELWHRENKPYALDWTLRRYQSVDAKYAALAKRLAAARKAAEAGKPLPSPKAVGLELIELGVRRTRPHKVVQAPLRPGDPWAEPAATHRLGLTVNTGSADRADLPIELDLRLPAELAAKPVRAFRLLDDGKTEELPAQFDPGDKPEKTRLVVLLSATLPKGISVPLTVYLGLAKSPKPLPGAASTKDGPKGAKWLENDKLRLLLAPEGAHIYRWEVKALGDRDLTMPGQTSWFGFADLGGSRRSSKNALVCTARGPALVRYVCTDADGTVKTISLFAGASWTEVTLNQAVWYYWEFDNPDNFAADGPTPGRCLFSNGATGPVGKKADGVGAQVKARGVTWGIKFVPGQLALGLATPEVGARHVVAPGAGAGGVGIEGAPTASHFITYGGTLEGEPAALMNRLAQTLDFRNPPHMTLHAIEARGGK